jgi:4-amino-4-deoxy-L-arabinose transferase-like glycosyltransferase
VIPRQRWIVFWIAAGVALRLAFALGYWVDQPLTHDEREYLALARSVARGQGFAYPADEPEPGTAQRFGRAPGYPAFLAAIGVTDPVDEVPARVKIAQSLLGGAIIWLIAGIAASAAGARAGQVAAVIAAIYPPLVFMPAYALSETLYSAVALAAAWTLDTAVLRSRTAERPSFAMTFVGGALVGCAILIRPAMVFFLPFAAIWLWRTRRTLAVICVVTAIACVVPWTIRNARVYGRVVFVASEGGVTFWTGNHPLAVGDGDLAANPRLKEAELVFRRAHADLTPEAREPLYYRDALQWIRGDPAAWIGLEARKLFYTIIPLGPSYRLHSAKYFAASAIPYVALLGPAAAGAWRLRRKGRMPIALWLMALSTVFAGLVFFPQERFRIPMIDPSLIVAASAVTLSRATGRRPDAVLLPLALICLHLAFCLQH